MRASLLRLVVAAVVLLIPAGAFATHQTASCSAQETFEFASIGSRHCEIILACPSAAGHACTWQLSVSVSGVGTVHGWIDGQQVDCSGINSCAASKQVSLSSGLSHQYMCLMDSPVLGLNMAMTCRGAV